MHFVQSEPVGICFVAVLMLNKFDWRIQQGSSSSLNVYFMQLYGSGEMNSSQQRLIRQKLREEFWSNSVGVQFTIAFNVGSHWSVSSGNGRIRRVGRINWC